MQSTTINPTGLRLADRLRTSRQSKSLTPAAAASQIGCHRSYLTKLEGGISTQPSADFLRKAAAVFEVSEVWLETGLGNPRIHVSEEQLKEFGQDAEFVAAITIALRRMTLDQLLHWASEINKDPNISPNKRAIWLDLITPWIGVQHRVEIDKEHTQEFGVARLPNIQDKWILKADSRVSHWDNLRRAILARTFQHGQRAALARLLKVTPQGLNEWLQGRNAPPAEQTLRLLQWVKQHDAEEKRAGSASTRPALKTRESKSNYEKAKSNQKKR